MQTTCSRCAAVMSCGAQEKNCWCQALPNLPNGQLKADQNCLCTACLHAQLAQGVVVYGIANCDTVKKARAWLTQQGVAHAFWDFKKHGVPPSDLSGWLMQLGWETVINRRGTSWRGLDPALQTSVCDVASAQALAVAVPSVIKRPIVAWGNTYGARLTIGFDAAAWQAIITIAPH